MIRFSPGDVIRPVTGFFGSYPVPYWNQHLLRSSPRSNEHTRVGGNTTLLVLSVLKHPEWVDAFDLYVLSSEGWCGWIVSNAYGDHVVR